MLKEDDLFYSNYSRRWCIGFNISQRDAIKLAGILNCEYGFGQSIFQVLYNESAKKHGVNYNFIINCYEKQKLIEVLPLISKVMSL
ncbi:hypothetical protein [Clostridium sp. 'White wine YQ']|uniref:hypothetical protein n=1 Tax=Clostridium sp. 'White wine YQ' TaxID=3027474 RepID=UPI0023670CE5|nr:hypothetical protein [Clostridium sp. 'White wine YQ']MDD7793677.1 hypothetical protein [Clostridium sp. 'White wine YQ']